MKSPELKPEIYEDLASFVASKKDSGDKLVEAYNDKILDIYSVDLEQKLEEMSNYLEQARNDEKMESKIKETEALLEQIKIKQSAFNLVWSPESAQFNDRTKALAIKKQINVLLSQINMADFIEYSPAKKLEKNIQEIAQELNLNNLGYKITTDSVLVIQKQKSMRGIKRILMHPNNQVQKIAVHCEDKVGNIGFSSIADALTDKNNKITEIDMSGNKIGDMGVQTFFNKINSPYCKIQEINFSDNNISIDAIIEIINNVSKANKYLRKIDLRQNIISLRELEKMREKIKKANLKVQIEM